MIENKITIKSGELRKLEILERLVDMTYEQTEQSLKLRTISKLSEAIGFINTDDGCGIKIFGNNNSICECCFEGLNTGVNINASESNMICNSVFNSKNKHGFEVQGNINVKGSGDVEFNSTGVKFGAVPDKEIDEDSYRFKESIIKSKCQNSIEDFNCAIKADGISDDAEEIQDMYNISCKNLKNTTMIDNTAYCEDECFYNIKETRCPNCNKIIITQSDIEYYRLKHVNVVIIECDCGIEDEYSIATE